jgi:hypothetical protein
MVLLWGCSSDPGITEDDPDEVAVTFSAGEVVTRANFQEGVSLKIFVYDRAADAPNPDFLQPPYKIVKGKINDVNGVEFTGGDISLPDNRLTVRKNSTYDFVIVVNGSVDAENLGKLEPLNAGFLTGFSNGTDVLSGWRKATSGLSGFTVVFDDLPHLCSAVRTEINVNANLITSNYVTSCGIDGVRFKECLPAGSELHFSGPTLTVDNTSYAASYVAPGVNSGTVNNTVPGTSNVVTSADGFLLPFPLIYSNRSYNIMNIDFHLQVNNVPVILYAPELQMPAFEAGKRYHFIIELAEGEIYLKLAIEDWSKVSWDGTMGGEGDKPFVQYTLGSWTVISWNAGMGGGSGSTQVLTTGGWTGVTWTSNMGGN